MENIAASCKIKFGYIVVGEREPGSIAMNAVTTNSRNQAKQADNIAKRND